MFVFIASYAQLRSYQSHKFKLNVSKLLQFSKLYLLRIIQNATQEALEDGDPTEKDLGDVSTKEDSTTVITNETQVEVQRIKEDASSLQNGIDKQQEISTRNPTERQKAAEKKHQTKKSNFGGLKKGFLL